MFVVKGWKMLIHPKLVHSCIDDWDCIENGSCIAIGTVLTMVGAFIRSLYFYGGCIDDGACISMLLALIMEAVLLFGLH